MPRLVVVGGGAAGMSAASAARRIDADLDIVVLERTQHVGYGMCGIPYFVSGVAECGASLFSYPIEFFRDVRGMDVRLGAEMIGLDPEARRVRYTDPMGGGELDYDALVLASGADPIVPAIPGADDERVFAIRKMEDAVVLRTLVESAAVRRAVVIGGGYVGLEMAEALVHRGLKVSLVEASSQVLPSFDYMVGETVEEEIRSRGVDVRLNCPVTAIHRRGEELFVDVVADVIPADVVIMAVGVRPATSVAALAGAAVTAAGALLVDHSMRTNLPDVYAAGDCIAPHHTVLDRPAHVPLGPTANKTGRIAGTVAAGGAGRFRGVVGTLVAKVFDLTVAATGLTLRQANAAGFDAVATDSVARSRAKYYPGAERMQIRLVHERHGRLPGAQMVGRDGVAKRIDILAAALQARFDLEDLLALDLAYAPPYSPVYDPILIAAQNALRAHPCPQERHLAPIGSATASSA